jgi:hypothetical protein
MLFRYIFPLKVARADRILSLLAPASTAVSYWHRCACHVGELSCWRIVMLANCHVGELSCWRIVCWWNVILVKCQLVKCQLVNCKLAICFVGEMSCWRIVNWQIAVVSDFWIKKKQCFVSFAKIFEAICEKALTSCIPKGRRGRCLVKKPKVENLVLGSL